MTTFTNVALSNTFNEFRQSHNAVANTITDITGGPNSDTKSSGGLFIASVSANTGNLTAIAAVNTSVQNLTVSTLTSGRIPVVGADSLIVDDAGLTFNTTTNALTVTGTTTSGNVTTGGTLAVTGTSTLTGTTTLGSGANNAVYYPANGSLILTSAGDASAIGRVDANHLHADWHVGAGGDLEAWATAKGDNADTHKIFAVANTNGPIDMLVVNQSEGANAYGEFIAIHATGNTADGWVSMGVNSSNYAEGAFGVTKADDAYVLYSAPAGTVKSGDLVIGTSGNGTGNKIIFSANGFDDPANNQQMVIHPAQKVAITINTQSSNTTTGALVVNGGIGLLGNLNVGGNVAITGTITLGGGGNTVSTSSLSVDNPLIFLGANNAADVLDLGVVGEYTSSGTKYAGLVRDASDSGVFKLFANNSSRPNNTVNFSDANVAYGTLLLDSVRANGGTASTSNTTGALIVTGGIGLTGRINGSGAIATTDTTASSSTGTGSIVGAGGLGIAGAAYIGGAVNLASTLGVTGKTTLSNTTKLQQVLEKITVSATAATGTINYDALTQAVLYYTTNASGNFTINLRGDSGTTLNNTLAIGETITVSFLNTNGATAYYHSAMQIDGSSVTPKWQGGSAPSSGNASSIDGYTYTAIKTANATFTVLASVAQFA